MGSDLYRLTATEAADQIMSRKVSVHDYLSSCLEVVDRLEPRVKAWVSLDREGALQQARQMDRRIKRGEVSGRMTGIPIGAKDIFNTAALPTSMGSPLWKDFTPGNDARVIAYLRWQEAIILGKTVTAEFAVHYNDITTNPHNYEHSPGTSSSGSAAAVASGMVPVALGTQTAGSIMRPASYCGVYGFKPSFGLVPRVGVLKTADTLDTVGMLSRSVEDIGLVFDIIRSKGTNYPINHRLLSDEQRQSPSDGRWRVALVKGPKWGCAEEYARTALLKLARGLSSESDLVLEEVDLDPVFERAHEVHGVIYDKSLAYYFRDESRQQAMVSDLIFEIFERGQKITLPEYLEALEQQRAMARWMDEFFADKYDAILTLSTGGEAPRGLTSPDRPDTCLIWTMTHLPVISLPVFRGPNGLPFGAQLVSRRYNDLLLLKLAKRLDQMVQVGDISEQLDRKSA